MTGGSQILQLRDMEARERAERLTIMFLRLRDTPPSEGMSDEEYRREQDRIQASLDTLECVLDIKT